MMNMVLDSVWSRSVGSIFMISIFVGYVTYLTIRRIITNYKRKDGIDGLDILLVCAIPSGVAFTWRWIGQIMDLFGVHITYDSSAVYPEINLIWIRIVFLIILILSVIGATVMFSRPIIEDKCSQKTTDEKEDKKSIFIRFLLTLGVWLFAGFPSLNYVIEWITGN